MRTAGRQKARQYQEIVTVQAQAIDLKKISALSTTAPLRDYCHYDRY
ncbi:hypothetical protein DSUL_40088 [Desulfovibrionales bacterium]